MKKISFKTPGGPEFTMQLSGKYVSFWVGNNEAGPFDIEYLYDIDDCLGQMIQDINKKTKKEAQEQNPSSTYLT